MSVEDILMEYATYLKNEHIDILKESSEGQKGYEGSATYVTSSSANKSA